MKKIPVRIVKKNMLNVNSAADTPYNRRNESPRVVAHKISNNVMSWVDELRERKMAETIRSFNLLVKAAR